MAQLSPLKRQKRLPQEAIGNDSAHIVLAQLARRVLEIALESYKPEEVYPLECLKIAEVCPNELELEQLKPPLLNAKSLAILQLEKPRESKRKRAGSFYTPPELATYITEQAMQNAPEGAIIDPACGGGVFLLAALDKLRELEPSTAPHTLAEKLYGLDLNPDAADLARLTLFMRLYELEGQQSLETLRLLARHIRSGNAIISDSPEKLESLDLFDNPGDGAYLASLMPFNWREEWQEVFEQGGFAVALGNPPYIGFNDYSGVEKAYFNYAYPQAYNLKADMLYYFLCRGIDILKAEGRLGFITARFWQEAAFGARLREWLAQSVTVIKLEDMRGQRLFSEAEVDNCLIFLEKKAPAPEHTLTYCVGEKEKSVEQRKLGSAPWAWLRRMPHEEMLLAKIQERSLLLGQVAECRTGVQTGLDAAFMVTAEIARGLEAEVVKPAIKNGQIVPPGVLQWNEDLYLIYLETGTNLLDYPNTAAYLAQFRQQLEQRLRYRQPFPWYELQWARTCALFEASAKLVTPYKAPRNRFALDTRQFYFSTDVVSVVFNEAAKEGIAPEGLLFEQAAAHFLNTPLSTWQFRSYSKQVGGGQYDYYANPVKNLAIPFPERLKQFPQLFEAKLDISAAADISYALYELTPDEIETIEQTR
ncbi:MAG: N-6 DNA methylase [Chloroflexi bacterium]|uniref:site-specific DNA-methyltransferase (adenine-specific) n=1 Tax=Candidatus Chlorohelix allophototropha TaxID=3003348 RepID=A0A8T7M9Z8_9CHLR|nr:N-6 DNA methylase [Chloroflexota bacterium]WJW68899.1 SAM-dependent methyltransferase [Chloroflexota bacterium L227-S17]